MGKLSDWGVLTVQTRSIRSLLLFSKNIGISVVVVIRSVMLDETYLLIILFLVLIDFIFVAICWWKFDVTIVTFARLTEK